MSGTEDDVSDQPVETGGADLTPDDTADSSPAPQSDGSADSSPANDDPESLTDAVLQALNGEESPASEEPGEEGAEATDQAPEDGQTEDGPEQKEEVGEDGFTDKERAQLNEKTRTRVQELLEQRKAKDEEVKALTAERDQMKTKADGYDNIQSYMRENNLSPKDAGQALKIASAINSGDPQAALQQLTPIVQQLAQQTGDLLPQDLQQAVRQGQITEKHARELSRARAAERLSSQRAQREKQTRERQTEEQRKTAEAEKRNSHVQSVSQAGARWDAERAQSDPDWSVKQPLVAQALEVDLHRNGFPRTVDEAKQRFDAAVSQVESQLGKFAPRKPKPSNPPASQGAKTDQPKPVPESGQEAVLRALGG